MKTKTILVTFFVAAIAFTFSNCSGQKKEEGHDHANHNQETKATEADATAAGAAQYQVDAAFQNQLASVFTAYIALKEAFVSSDPTKVKAEATTTLKGLANADMKLLSGAAHHDWMTYMKSLEGGLKKIEMSGDIEEQRKSFSEVSDGLYKSIKAFGMGGATVYYEFCPMAFDNQGGFWLSNEEKIRNPYFGDKMLTCGSVQEKIQ